MLPVAGLLAVTAGLGVNWLVPTVRFTSVRLNYLTMLVAFLLPALALVLALRGTEGPARWALGILLVPLAAAGLALGVGMVATCPECIGRGQDPTFVPVKGVTAYGHRLEAYRVHLGPSRPPGIVVREERRIVPGLDWVRRVGGLADATHVDIEPLSAGVVRFSYPPVPGHRDAVVDAVVRVAGSP